MLPTPEETYQETAWIYPACSRLAELTDEHKSKKIKRISTQTNWSSRLGHPCELYLTLCRTSPEKAALHEVGLQYIFDEGQLQEDAVLRLLEDMGVRVLERGVSVGNDSLLRELNVSGLLDAVVSFDRIANQMPVVEGIDWSRKRIVVEVKSVSPHLFDSITDYDSLKTHKKHYVQGWADQIDLYLLGRNQEAGMLILKNKTSGRLKFIPIILDMEECDRLAAKAKRINEAVERYHKDQSLPNPIKWRQDVCAECPFLAICPNSREIPATEISTDADLIALLERREQLKPYLHEDDEAKEQIDHKLEQFKGTPVLVGNYQVRWSHIVKPSQMAPAQDYYRKQITKLPS